MRLFAFAAVTLLLGPGLWAQDGAGPSNPKAQKTFQDAVKWAQQGDYTAAIDLFRKANTQDGGHCEECAHKIVKYGEQVGDFKAAESAAQQLIADAKDARATATAHLECAAVLYREGLTKNKSEIFTDADREFQAVLSAFPNDANAQFYDGMSLAHLNQDDAARQHFERVLTVTGKDDVMRQRAQRYLANPELARARMAPPFAVTTLSGEQISLDGLAGKVVLIDFWATWCGPCREALPSIQAIARKFQGEPFVVLSVSLDKDETAWKTFVAKNNMTWLQYRDGYWTGPIAQLFGVKAIPHTFTIDADGVLQDEQIGDASIQGKLKKLCARARQLQEAPQVAMRPGGN